MEIPKETDAPGRECECRGCGSLSLIQIDGLGATAPGSYQNQIHLLACFASTPDNPQKEAAMGPSRYGTSLLLLLLQVVDVRVTLLHKLNAAVLLLTVYELNIGFLNNLCAAAGIMLFLYFYFGAQAGSKVRALRIAAEIAVYALYLWHRLGWTLSIASVDRLQHEKKMIHLGTSEAEIAWLRGLVDSVTYTPLAVVLRYVGAYYALLCMHRGIVMLRMMASYSEEHCSRLAAALHLGFTDIHTDVYMFACAIAGVLAYIGYGQWQQLEVAILAAGATSLLLTALPTARFPRCRFVYL